MYLVEAGIAAGALLLASASVLYARRASLYRSMRAQLSEIGQSRPGTRTGTAEASHLRLPSGSILQPAERLPAFNDRLAAVDEVLAPEALEVLRQACERLATERSFVPTHKKGGTVAYETLCNAAPQAVAIYLSLEMRTLVSRIVGATVEPTPPHDQSSCSLLFYERPGDHIGWHYDHNFYKGRHFTVLLPLVNRDASGEGLSTARLTARIGDEERVIETPPNRLVVFEGALVQHKASPIRDGERRILLSMTYATDVRSSPAQGIARRIKDTAFFGIRALWT